jgi:hypothetical protein
MPRVMVARVDEHDTAMGVCKARSKAGAAGLKFFVEIEREVCTFW